jgi:hypothetical protein
MSLHDTDVVDQMGIDPLTEEVVLTIADDLDWSDPGEHLRLLQAKLLRYISFIESGDIYTAYPESRNRLTAIALVSRHAPAPEARELLAETRELLQESGIRLRLSLVPLV